MKFCPNCGSRLVVSKREDKVFLTCPKPGCGYEETVKRVEMPVISEPRAEAGVLKILGKEEQELHPLPVVKAECPKCGNARAYWWMAQTRGMDESPTQFFRCVKCSYTWRSYG